MPEKQKVRMNYDTMREMTKQFQAAQRQLQETLSVVQKQGSEMEGGGLQGQAGETFVATINGPLTQALQALSMKMEELGKDVNSAREALELGVKTATKRFQD